jgi:hypothetical protein
MERVGIYLGLYHKCLIRILHLGKLYRGPLDELDNNRKIEEDEESESVIIFASQVRDSIDGVKLELNVTLWNS